MFSLICLTTYNEKGFYSITLNKDNSEIEIDPIDKSAQVFFTYQLPDSTFSSPEITFQYPNEKLSRTFSFNENTGISFIYPRVNISYPSASGSISFNIYILDNGACNTSFLALGNIKFEIYSNSANTVCVFPYNIPKKVDAYGKNPKGLDMYAYKYHNVIDYSFPITKFVKTVVLTARYHEQFNGVFEIYDSTDPDFKTQCNQVVFKVLNNKSLDTQNYDGNNLVTCLTKPSSSSSSKLILIILVSLFGLIVVISVVCVIICCCCLKPRPLNLDAQAKQGNYNYSQYTNHQGQNHQPLIQDQEEVKIQYQPQVPTQI